MLPRGAPLLEIIRNLKSPELSDLDAALNVVINHAAEIARLQHTLRELRSQIAAAIKDADSAWPYEDRR